MQFPRLVYKSAEVHLLVKDEDEQAEALENGWFASVPEALGAVKGVPDEQPVAPVVQKPAVTQGASGKRAPAWNKKPAANPDETI